MKKLKSNFRNMVLVLAGITFFAALALASVYSVTKGPIQQSKLAKQQDAIQAVLPPFDHLDANPVEINNGGETLKVYKAYDAKNRFVGAAVESSSSSGYSGKINVMVGFDKAGVIVNYVVLEQKETPGLGAKMLDWFKSGTKKQCIIGKDPATTNLSVSKDGGEVDGITAATISSRAFLFAVRNAYNAWVNNCPKISLQVVRILSDSLVPVSGKDSVADAPKGERMSGQSRLIGKMRAILPPFYRIDEKPVVVKSGAEVMRIYKAYDKQNQQVGAAVESSSSNGYAGRINVLVGFDKKGVIVDYIVLEQNETEGLGSKIIDWFRTGGSKQVILGKSPAMTDLRVWQDGGEVDGITAATISSRAFLSAIRNAYSAYTNRKPVVHPDTDATTGASDSAQ